MRTLAIIFSVGLASLISSCAPSNADSEYCSQGAHAFYYRAELNQYVFDGDTIKSPIMRGENYVASVSPFMLINASSIGPDGVSVLELGVHVVESLEEGYRTLSIYEQVPVTYQEPSWRTRIVFENSDEIASFEHRNSAATGAIPDVFYHCGLNRIRLSIG